MSAPLKGRFNFKEIDKWSRKFGQIQSDTAEGVVDYIPNPIQADFLGNSKAFRGYPVVDAVIKPRQCGFSTACMIFITGLAKVHPGISMIAVAPSKKIMRALKRKWKIIQTNIMSNPDCGLSASHLDADNEDEFAWSNGSVLAFYTVGGTQNTAENVGRAGSYAFCWYTEMAFPGESALMSAAWESLWPALRRSGASIVIDSTLNPKGPEGPGKTYVDTLRKVSSGDLPGRVFFWEWWKDPKNREDLRTTPEKFIRSMTSEEKTLSKRAGLSLAQLQFKRSEISGKSEMTKAQAKRAFRIVFPELESDAYEVLDSGSLFDEAHMENLREINLGKLWPRPLPASELSDLLLDSPLDPMREHAHGIPTGTRGFCRIWERPAKGLDYYIGVDGADGLKGSDWQSATVEDFEGNVVARIVRRMDRIRFAALVQRLAIYYNGAWIRGELQYGELIFFYIMSRINIKDPKIEATITFPGEVDVLKQSYRNAWVEQTTERNRPDIIEAAFSTFNHGGGCKDPESLAEMEGLFRDHKDKVRARSKKHDDIFMSTGIAELARRQKKQGYEHDAPFEVKSGLTRSTSIGGRSDYLPGVNAPRRGRGSF